VCELPREASRCAARGGVAAGAERALTRRFARRMVAAQVQKTSAYFSRYQVKYRRRRGA
jgi:hypothetical protein